LVILFYFFSNGTIAFKNVEFVLFLAKDFYVLLRFDSKYRIVGKLLDVKMVENWVKGCVLND